MLTFRTYGCSKIDRNRIYGKNRFIINKPSGLWASPQGKSFYTWEDFCVSESFNLETLGEFVDFELDRDCKVLYITNDEQLTNAYRQFGCENFLYEFELDECLLDWEKIKNEYDAVLVLCSNFNSETLMKYNLTAWDVDSLCVFNLSKIKEKVRH